MIALLKSNLIVFLYITVFNAQINFNVSRNFHKTDHLQSTQKGWISSSLMFATQNFPFSGRKYTRFKGNKSRYV